RGVESVDVLVSLATAFVFAFMVDVNTLLGQNVLLNFITGRYYAPRVDWKLKEGTTDGRCVAACFAAIDQLARHAPDYRRELGEAVAVRAGLHCGPVVTGEMGSVRKEIVFLGDTVNTAARIQELCRQTGDRVIASADLIDRLKLPRGIAKRSLGDLRLRGKGADLALYALTKTPPRAGRARPQRGEIAREETPAALS
ncbi:MAG TPA: adenylate/guanylate cyclase domain-containing protein, partial [Roseiarcus sp.]|nr:adenylate/guanylate cyclase domain-containing protein [Roseiarcus sp.]